MTNLRRLREAAGLSQVQLGDRSGVSFRMVQYYEQGKKDINRAQAFTIYLLAQALNCKMEDLIEPDYLEEI